MAGRPESYFRQPDELRWARRWQIPTGPDGSFDYRDYVQAAIAAGSTENGVFGGRVMWRTVDEMVTKLGAVHPRLAARHLDLLTEVFGRLHFCHLRRADALAQAVGGAGDAELGALAQHHPAARLPQRRPPTEFEEAFYAAAGSDHTQVDIPSLKPP